MRIIAGWHYDGGVYPDELQGREAAQGIVIIGPLGLTSILETRLGLAPPRTSQPVRIAQYMRALEILCAEADPYFKQSFLADGWSTAKRLLTQRDQLRLAGWRGSSSGAHPRIEDLVKLDKVSDLAAGLPERLERITRSILHKGLRGVSQVTLETPRISWPSACRRVFDSIEASGDAVIGEAQPVPCSQFAIEGSTNHIHMLRCATLQDGAEAVASWLAAEPEQNDKVLLLAECGGETLDLALRQHGLAVTGSSRRSPHRAALQLLPLALALRWKPFSPIVMLEFLTAPLSPVHPAMARHLIHALAEQPGIGGPCWQNALESCRKWAAGRPDGNTLMADLTFWTGERSVAFETNMAAQAVRDVCEKLATWASDQTTQSYPETLPIIAAMAHEMSEVVKVTGCSEYTKPQLDRIIDSVVGAGLPGSGCMEASSWNHVMHPGQIRGDCQTILWWNFTTPGLEHTFRPWTIAERNELQVAGVDFGDVSRIRALEVAAWRNPLRHATGQLLLILPDSDKGSPVAPHPLWDEICTVEGASSILERTYIGTLLHSGAITRIFCRDICQDMLPASPTPHPQRKWPLSPCVESKRKCESPSGMAQLLECPLKWYFSHALRIRTGRLTSLPEGNQLYGKVCHRLIELLVAERKDWDAIDARKRAEQLFDDLLNQMAAALKLPGRDAELEIFRSQALEAVERLFGRIKDAGLIIAASEQQKARTDEYGQEHAGIIDLLLQDRKGRLVPWDLKWADRSRYRRDELEGGRALQLAAYCWLAADDTSFPADAAYFMLKQAELVSTNAPWAAGEEATSTDLKLVWEISLTEYRKRFDELTAGLGVAAGVKSEEADDTPQNPGPKCVYCDYSAICGVIYEG